MDGFLMSTSINSTLSPIEESVFARSIFIRVLPSAGIELTTDIVFNCLSLFRNLREVYKYLKASW